MKSLTLEEQSTNYETLKHIRLVQKYLNVFVKELIERGEKHDDSKMVSPELEAYTEVTKELAGLTYNSPEYNEGLKKLGPALTHHYANNSHHPQFYQDGINDMSLLDVIEMFCDWKAASKRHNDGNINKSININADRFSMSPQLVKIFENTVRLLED